MWLILIGLAALTFWGGVQKSDSKRVVVIGFNDSSTASVVGYLAHEADGDFDEFREPFYPVAWIDVVREETWIALPARNGTLSNIAKVSSTDSFTVRICDGVDEQASGTVWDFPPMDQREPTTIAPGSPLDEILKEYTPEMQELMRNLLNGVPGPGEAIPKERRDALIGAMQRVLREKGDAWIADGINQGRWTRSAVNYRGWVLLAFSIIGMVGLGLLLSWLQVRKPKTA